MATYKCARCGATFSKKQLAVDHVKETHGVPFPALNVEKVTLAARHFPGHKQ